MKAETLARYGRLADAENPGGRPVNAPHSRRPPRDGTATCERGRGGDRAHTPATASAHSNGRRAERDSDAGVRLNKGRVHFVVVFNLTRFARDKYDHFALRSHLQSLGISLR